MRLTRLLLAFAGAALISTGAAAQTTMRMNISIGQNSHYGIAIDTFAQELEKRTGGRADPKLANRILSEQLKG
jgi:TRAP-type C4-dicarboxylate transport system substrate-binding protein